jgi:hypothetical protein
MKDIYKLAIGCIVIIVIFATFLHWMATGVRHRIYTPKDRIGLAIEQIEDGEYMELRIGREARQRTLVIGTGDRMRYTIIEDLKNRYERQ